MWENIVGIQNAVLLIYLAVEAAADIRKKEITVPHVTVLGVLGVICMLFRKDATEILLGIVPGCLCLMLSRVTEEAIGYGDGNILIICGMVLGAEKVCMMLLLALLFMMPFSLWMLIVRRASRKKEVAFLPFLLAAYLVTLSVV